MRDIILHLYTRDVQKSTNEIARVSARSLEAQFFALTLVLRLGSRPGFIRYLVHTYTVDRAREESLPSMRRRNKLGSHFELELETDISRSACLARIGGRLLIEIDFGTETERCSPDEDRGRRRGAKKEGRQTRARKGERARGSDEDLRLSNFISVQLGAGLLGVEAIPLTPIPTDDC